jgi:hypothetical protein
MRPEQKTLVTTAFEALGIERVTRGLEATGHSWNDCFLAVAISGEPGELTRQLEKRWRKEYAVGTLLGVRVQVVNQVVARPRRGSVSRAGCRVAELNRAAHDRAGGRYQSRCGR